MLSKCVRLVWNAVSALLGLSFSCLPCWFFHLVWDAACAFLSLSLVLSLSLFPILSSSWSGMLWPPPWSCLPAGIPSCLSLAKRKQRNKSSNYMCDFCNCLGLWWWSGIAESRNVWHDYEITSFCNINALVESGIEVS